MFKKLLLALSCLSVAACASTPTLLRFERMGTSQQDFMKDRLECIKQAQQPSSIAQVSAYGGTANSRIVISRGVMVTCLAAKGYNVTKDGPLVAPDEAAVRVVD
jgi:hypothetical protein